MKINHTEITITCDMKKVTIFPHETFQIFITNPTHLFIYKCVYLEFSIPVNVFDTSVFLLSFI